MADLPLEIRELLERARAADEPDLAARERNGRALAAHLGSAPAAWLEPPRAQPAPAQAQRPALHSGFLSLKSFGFVAALGLASGAGWWALSSAARVSTTTQPQPSADAQRAPAAVRPSGALPTGTSDDSAGHDTPPPTAATENSATPDDPQAASPDTLQRELALIEAASRALDAHDPRAALELVRRHEASFETGLLREEREALRLMASCDRGAPPARVLALRRAFELRYPRSPQRLRVIQHCGLAARLHSD